MSFFGNIGHFFKIVGKAIAHGFVALVGEKAAKAFVSGAKAILKTPLGMLALDAVNFAETLALGSGAEKRIAAAEKLAKDALAAGLTVSTSVVNLLIETAVSALKGNFTE